MTNFGKLMRRWRSKRRMSQLELALEVNISARHISFIETGRARPSRAAVLRVAEVLDVPLRERNDLLTAAGFAPAFRETGLDAAAMTEVRRALDLIVERHLPYPAIVMDRGWDVVIANAPALGMIGQAPLAASPEGRANAMDLIFSPEGLRPAIRNWESVAGHLLRRLMRQADSEGGGGPAQDLLERMRRYSGVAEMEASYPAESGGENPLILMEIDLGGQRLRLFSALATFGTAQDITLAELRIEMYFPADEGTRSFFETGRTGV